MLLQSLELTNIRSHSHTKVDFSQGITLLAGDIGAGKTTLLLAIEFALFGTRTDVSGESLLRHGEQEGSVTLAFQCNNQSVTIHRPLKRTSKTVSQKDGYLEIDGERQSLTARELKAHTLRLLGYPESLVTKSKGLVFRYTVYTPQEQMKQILFESDSARLDTLRSVFGVDTYQRSIDNAEKIARHFRRSMDILSGSIQDMDSIQEEQTSIADSIVDCTARLTSLRIRETKFEAELERIKLKGKHLEEAFQANIERKKLLASIDTQIKEINRQQRQIRQDMDEFQELKSKTVEPVEDPSQTMQKLRVLQDENQQAAAAASATLSHIDLQLTNLRESVADIDMLDECPKCKQDVSSDHKQHIADDVKSQEDALQKEHDQSSKKLQAASNNLEKLEKKEQALREKEVAFRAYSEHQAKLVEAAKHVEKLQARLSDLREKEKELARQQQELGSSSFDQDAYDAHKKEIDQQVESLQTVRVDLAKAETESEQLVMQQERLKNRLEAKKDEEQKLKKIQQQERWLKHVMIPAAQAIEQQVLRRIHEEFSALFARWFSELIEDEAMEAYVSETFAPLITQDGYDQDIAHLSGGEKTSVALAYRLALNTVINEFLSGMHTTGVLILDEPTDGFSSQQLDKVRDVLRQLGVHQIILVSHEQKMESFVDNIIRVEKREHLSQVGSV